LLRSANSCAIISVPSSLFAQERFSRQLQHLADAVVSFHSFAGLGVEPNEAFADFSGHMTVKKLPHLNSLNAPMPETLNYVYKLKRRKLQIEIPHLGPQESRTSTNTAAASSSSSSSSSKTSSTTTKVNKKQQSSSVSSMLCQPGPQKGTNELDF
jgi:elongator complex protein 4